MTEIKTYHLKPNPLIPNSPYPLLHYPGFFSSSIDQSTTQSTNQADPAKAGLSTILPKKAHDLFALNGWQTQWIYRYGPTQPSHYHSATHECMAVLSGHATIRFGAADTHGDAQAHEDGGVELRASAGDVFVIPAGVSHKTFDALPTSEFALLTPGDGHRVAGADVGEVLEGVELSGFTMVGAYPAGGVWDFSEGGEHVGGFQGVWDVPSPERDPVLGVCGEGVCGLWR